MIKKILTAVLIVFLCNASYVFAVTKPAPGTDVDSLSYVFYFYYDNNQLFGDRDYEIKYDVINEKFVEETITAPLSYKADIINLKSEVVKTFKFDPQKGDPNFRQGKVSVKGPYAPDGLKVNFYDAYGKSILIIPVAAGSICDGDGFCNSGGGEDDKTCPLDCKKARTSPQSQTPELPVDSEGPELTLILIYVFGGLGVGVISWLGWKWWKKKKEGDFTIPPSSVLPPQPPSSLN